MFKPIAALNRTDGDVMVIFVMQYELGYLGPSNDPIFGATSQEVEEQIYSGKPVNQTFYYNENPVQPLACVQKQQWCNPNYGTDNCTQWMGDQFSNSTMHPWSHVQRAVAYRMSVAFQSADLTGLVRSLGAEGLLATTNVGGGYGANPLPDNQWTIEISHWLATYLATAQILIAQFATGSGNAHIDSYFVRPADWYAWMCGAQIVQREDYYTFYMPGVLLIVIGTSVMVIANLVIMWCAQRNWPLWRRNKTGLQTSAWQWYSQLHLQSEVYQAMGLGNWDRGKAVPVLDKDATIFSAPFSRDLETQPMTGLDPVAQSKEPKDRVSEVEMSNASSTSDIIR